MIRVIVSILQNLNRLQSYLCNSKADHTQLEVERKFRITEPEKICLQQKLLGNSFNYIGSALLRDWFLPTANADEMIRVRQEKQDTKNKYILTCKSWVYLTEGKERKETECELSSWSKNLLLWTGRWVKRAQLDSFDKKRKMYGKSLEDREIIVSLDQLDELGEFSGNYVEIEILVPINADVQFARTAILQLAADLLGDNRESIQYSYLDMLKMAKKHS